MKRAAFAAGVLGALAVPGAVLARTVHVRDLVARIPGVTGVYARTLDDDAPLVSVRAGEPFASASVIKLAIMLTAYRAYDAGTASPDDFVTLRAADLIGGSDVLAYARPGQRFRMRELVRAMIQQSDNSASNSLISTFGFGAINDVIRAAGLTGTRLGRHFADYVPPRARQRQRHDAARYRDAAVRHRTRLARTDRYGRESRIMPRHDRRPARSRRQVEDSQRPPRRHALRQ